MNWINSPTAMFIFWQCLDVDVLRLLSKNVLISIRKMLKIYTKSATIEQRILHIINYDSYFRYDQHFIFILLKSCKTEESFKVVTNNPFYFNFIFLNKNGNIYDLNVIVCVEKMCRKMLYESWKAGIYWLGFLTHDTLLHLQLMTHRPMILANVK